jgi:hypothetical protein
MAALDTIDGPFDLLPHTTDLREIDAPHSGRYNIPSVGLFVWRLKVYPVTQAPAYNLEQEGPNFFTFSTLSNDAPLFTKAEPESGPTDIADESNVPGPIRRVALDARVEAYYGLDKSFYIWVGEGGKKPAPPGPAGAHRGRRPDRLCPSPWSDCRGPRARADRLSCARRPGMGCG